MFPTRSTLISIVFPACICIGLCISLFCDPVAQWQVPSLRHPLGTDEFGRDILASVLSAAGFSLGKGLVMTSIIMALALFIAELITLRANGVTAFFLRLSANIMESVPTVLWVMIVIIVIPSPRFLVVSTAFTLVSLPFAINIASGEFLRLRRESFVEAGYLLGISEPVILLRYLLPNAIEVLLPYTIQLLGMAIAVDGAIGVIGLGNRSNLDLGIFLLRGKEYFILHPQIMLAALTMYGIEYAYLIWIGNVVKRIFHERQQ